MGKALLFASFLTFAGSAVATDYTDLWWVPTESGWGVNLVQSENDIFLTFYIYGPTNQPTWYSSLVVTDGAGGYSGSLYATMGTYFGRPWNPADHPEATPVGTASFVPGSPYDGTLTYALTGGPTVTKTITRATLTPFTLAGGYSGSVSGSITGCASPANNVAVLQHRVSLEVTQQGEAFATLTHTIVENGVVCTLSGPLTHVGRIYRMVSAQYKCGANGTISANVEELQRTAQGIEGRWTADDGGGCMEAIRFSAVLN